MVKRRRARRIYGRARRTYRRASSAKLNTTNLLLGSGLIAVGEPVLDNYISKFTGGLGMGIPVDGAKAALGYIVAKKMRNPIIKSAGVALMVIGIRNLVKPLAGGLLGTAANGGGVSYMQTIY